MKILLFFLNSLLLTSAFAENKTVGSYIPEAHLPESACLLVHLDSNGLVNGTCSATLISTNEMITARHCVRPGKIVVQCEKGHGEFKQKVTRSVKQAIISDKFMDLAILKLDEEMNIEPMKVADEKDLELLIENPSSGYCLAIGYGKDNNGETGIKHGVNIQELSIDGNYLRKSVIPDIINDFVKSPNFLFNIVSQTSMVNSNYFFYLKKIKSGQKLTTEEEKDFNYEQQKNLPLVKQLISSWVDQYQKKLNNVLESRKQNFVFITRGVTSESRHTSIVLAGDSGGTVACLNQTGEYVLVGVISAGLVKYGTEEISTKGAVTPLIYEAHDLIERNTSNVEFSPFLL